MMSNSTSTGCVCIPEFKDGHRYVQWIGTVFSDCIYTTADQVSFALGLLNIGFWLFAQLPQMYENYKAGKVEALSKGLIVQWLLGDIFNLAGCILTNQLPTQTYTAIYFCATDAILLVQYAWYLKIKPYLEAKKALKYEKLSTEEEGINGTQTPNKERHLYSLGGIALFSAFTACTLYMGHSAAANKDFRYGRQLLAADGPSKCDLIPDVSHTNMIIGSVLAWCSGMMYFCSRIPQIYHNYRRKSVAGLSKIMFTLAVLANLSYGLSIILRLPAIDDHFFEATLPYVIGSLGTLIFDSMIMMQTWLYRKQAGYILIQ
eukprot:Colp12_sorted_trinity150504_noHs@2727